MPTFIPSDAKKLTDRVTLDTVIAEYLAAYVAMFEWAHNLKRVTADFLRTLMLPDFTYLPT